MKQFPVSLTPLLLVFAFALAQPARAQTPPNEPSDFFARIVVNAAPATFLELVSSSPNVQWLPGSFMGNFFEDFTNKRARVEILALDGTPLQSVYFFYDKKVHYTWNYTNGSCHRAASTAPLHPFFNLGAAPQGPPNEVEVDQLGLSTWTFAPAADAGWNAPTVNLTIATDSQQTPIAIQWAAPFAPKPAVMTFAMFASGAPDASLFNLPAGCAK